MKKKVHRNEKEKKSESKFFTDSCSINMRTMLEYMDMKSTSFFLLFLFLEDFSIASCNVIREMKKEQI